MTPLFPFGLIDQGWYLLIIFLVGLFFGLVLEQSGFSSSRKLAGVFYGYDFVVLKVFFTAGITAMAGLVILGYFGFVDLGAVYVNSNFLVSAVVGGVIMGFGFILGGFCPGTSITGAVIGKIDAWFFIFGVFAGIFTYGVFSNTFNQLFTGYYFNQEMLSETLGISKHWLVFLFIVMALVAFGVGGYFEKRATKGLRPTNQRYSKYGIEILLALVIGVIILTLPPGKARSVGEKNEQVMMSEILHKSHSMSADELAYLMINNPKVLQIIDVRSEEEYAEFHFPGSIRIPPVDINYRDNRQLYKETDKKTVLVSNGGGDAACAAMVLIRKNHHGIYILDGGLNGFVETIFENNTPQSGATDMADISKYRFRKKAAAIFKGEKTDLPLLTPMRKPLTPTLKTVPSAGGC